MQKKTIGTPLLNFSKVTRETMASLLSVTQKPFVLFVFYFASKISSHEYGRTSTPLTIKDLNADKVTPHDHQLRSSERSTPNHINHHVEILRGSSIIVGVYQ